ncbi:hypothetical protein [Variovorax sp.]|uniref:hypothetical protein n=1 Tax=Variovorax sp. TaxID=1871043 RepID=UPI003BAC5AB8
MTTQSTNAAGLPNAIAFEINLAGCSVPQDFHQFAQSCAALGNELRIASKKLFPGSQLTFAPHGRLGQPDWTASAWLTQLFLAEVERHLSDTGAVRKNQCSTSLAAASPGGLLSASPPPEAPHKPQTPLNAEQDS